MALQHLNVSHNALRSLKIEKCNFTKTLETIDLSDIGQEVHWFLNSPFFDCRQFKNIHLRNNMISYIFEDWNIFHDSLKTLDLRQNDFYDFAVRKYYL